MLSLLAVMDTTEFLVADLRLFSGSLDDAELFCNVGLSLSYHSISTTKGYRDE